jgi:uncharacterized protein (DUF433 family)
MNSTSYLSPTSTLTIPIQQDIEKLGGQPTIGNKRVQVATLLDYLSDGLSLADFYRDFPSVTQAEAQAVLAVIKKAVTDGTLTGVELTDEDIV